MRSLSIVVPALAVALLAACGSDPGGDTVTSPGTSNASPTSAPATPTVPTQNPSDPGPSVGSDMPADLRERPAVAKAIADAATRSTVPEEKVLLAAWTPVTWNDGSLGCAQPGQVYTQATVDGQLLILRVDMTLLAYHAGPDGVFTFCPDPSGDFTVRSP